MTDIADETTLLAEEVGRLRERLEKAESNAIHWKGETKWLNRKFQIANFWAWMVAVPLIGAICALPLYPAYMAITTSSATTHCYVTTSSARSDTNGCPCVKLKGNIEWGSDVTLGAYGTIEEAIAAAEAMQCPLRAPSP